VLLRKPARIRPSFIGIKFTISHKKSSGIAAGAFNISDAKGREGKRRATPDRSEH